MLLDDVGSHVFWEGLQEFQIDTGIRNVDILTSDRDYCSSKARFWLGRRIGGGRCLGSTAGWSIRLRLITRSARHAEKR